ncbi:unnamed protein product [Durusdinium trenchii]|uniref:Ion transport domain-containing protein n=1 Tax=Durusdinium trenchii TaxID=1381693 RepID=A0ABP0KNG5_9DINO
MPQPKKLSAPLNMARGDDESMDLHRWLRHVLAEHHRGLEQRLVELREGQRYITHLLTSSHDPEVVRIGKAVSFQDIEAEITKEEEKDEKVLGPVESCFQAEEDEDEDEVDFRTVMQPKFDEGSNTTMKARRSSSLKDTDFALREVWAKHLKFKDRSVGSQPSNTLETIGGTLGGSAPVKLPMSESMERLPARKNSLIAYPAQKSRVCWDLFGGLLILYDLFVIPLKVFDYPESLFTEMMDWMTLCFWTLNVPATLTVGYTFKGETIMRPRDIFINYCKTWMIVDIITLTPDWAFTLVRLSNPNLADETAQSSGFEEEGVRLLRILRLARTARLLRLLKLQKVMEKLSDYLDSEVASIMANICKMILLLLALNHMIACVWYAISLTLYDGGMPAWVDESRMLMTEWDNRYVTSFHWSITQFTPASKPPIQPQNTVERAFAIFVVVFALVGFSYVVGSILASLAQLRSMSEQSAKDFWMMRRFLRRNNVPMELASRIQRFVEHAFVQQQKKMSIHEVKVLQLLSDGLMEELQCAMNLPHMIVHPLLAFLNSFSVITVQRLAKESVHRAQLARGDTQFLPNQEGSFMYFIAGGRMQYIRDADGPDPRVEVVDTGEDWIAEPVMWTPFWIHVGQLTAISECDLVAVAPKAFGEIVALIRPVAALVARYSSNFMQWVKELESRDELSDVIQGDEAVDQIRSFLD